jgi:hypothetical protein
LLCTYQGYHVHFSLLRYFHRTAFLEKLKKALFAEYALVKMISYAGENKLPHVESHYAVMERRARKQRERLESPRWWSCFSGRKSKECPLHTLALTEKEIIELEKQGNLKIAQVIEVSAQRGLRLKLTL